MNREFLSGESAPETAPSQSVQEFTVKDVASLNVLNVPYGMLVEVKSETGENVFQTLEKADSENIGLNGYRQKIVEQILKDVTTHPLVVLIGPSRAGKTETVLKGDRFFSSKDTLVGKSNSIFFDRSDFNEIKRTLAKLDTQPDTLLIDEYNGNLTSEELQELLQDHKVVLAIGGRLANKAKKDALKFISVLGGAPIIEMGIKPLNEKQLREVFEKVMSNREADRVNTSWNTFRALFQNENIPLPPYIAAQHICNTFKMREVHGEVLEVSDILAQLSDPSGGNIVSLDEIY